MFRKPKASLQRRKQQQRQTTKDAVEDDTKDEQDLSVQERIRQTQKKQKLLSSLPTASGNKETVQLPTNETKNTTTGELSVLAQKHQSAMEDFVQEQLQGTAPPPETTTETKEPPADSKAALYQELAQEAAVSANTVEQPSEDKGAMLMGGTGIAEVILPSTSSNHTQPQPKRPLGSSAMLSNSNQLSQPPSMRAMIGNRETKDKPALATTTTTVITTDDDRLGFAAFQSQKTGADTQSKPKGRPNKRQSRDDEVFVKFIKRQREKR